MYKNRWIGVILCFVSFLCTVQTADAAKRTALVIGNGAYDSAPLKNPVNDAVDMAKALRELGFDVIEKTDARKRDMILAVDEFAKRLREAEIGVFYFAGHGMQIHGRNYLIPVKAHVTSETDVQFEAMDAGRVLGKMQDAGNKLNIVILDACRDNPFKRSFRTETVGLAQMDAPKGSIIAYATAPGSVAADGRGRNGLYTKHLLKSLAASGLTVQDVFMETGMGVMKETGDKQIPWMSLTPVPRYYLASKGKGPEFNAERATLEKERQELERLRAEIEKKQRESQNERVEVASVPQQPTYSSSSPSASSETERDGMYVAYANGIVRDTSTGLEWKAGPDTNTQWYEARLWVQSLGGDWRMPTMDELAGLYKSGKGSRNMTPFLKTTGWWVWSDGTKGSYDAWGFDFYYGGYKVQEDFGFPAHNGRAFAVRSQSNQEAKAEFELERRETQQGRAEVASVPQQPTYSRPLPSPSNVTDQDGVYVAYADGIVRDTSTGLEWKVGPDRDTDWNEARSWVQNLSGDWRMPTSEELEGIYKEGLGERNMTSFLKTTGWDIWSSDAITGGNTCSFVGFTNGRRSWTPRRSGENFRVFAVRSRSEG